MQWRMDWDTPRHPARALRRAAALLPREDEAFPSSPAAAPARWPLPPVPRVPRGRSPGCGLGALQHCGADPARVHMSRIHMHVSRGKQLPSGSGERTAGLAPGPVSLPVPSPSRAFLPFLPDASRCRWLLQGAERGPLLGLSPGKKSFLRPRCCSLGLERDRSGFPLKVARQSSGVWKSREDAFGTLGLNSQEFLPRYLPRPREGTWQGPRQGKPRNSPFISSEPGNAAHTCGLNARPLLQK